MLPQTLQTPQSKPIFDKFVSECSAKMAETTVEKSVQYVTTLALMGNALLHLKTRNVASIPLWLSLVSEFKAHFAKVQSQWSQSNYDQIKHTIQTILNNHMPVATQPTHIATPTSKRLKGDEWKSFVMDPFLPKYDRIGFTPIHHVLLIQSSNQLLSQQNDYLWNLMNNIIKPRINHKYVFYMCLLHCISYTYAVFM